MGTTTVSRTTKQKDYKNKVILHTPSKDYFPLAQSTWTRDFIFANIVFIFLYNTLQHVIRQEALTSNRQKNCCQSNWIWNIFMCLSRNVKEKNSHLVLFIYSIWPIRTYQNSSWLHPSFSRFTYNITHKCQQSGVSEVCGNNRKVIRPEKPDRLCLWQACRNYSCKT